MQVKHALCGLMTGLLLLAVGTPMRAATPVPFITPTFNGVALPGNATGTPFYIGYKFEVGANDILVSSLGVQVNRTTGNSNDSPHAVGLWRASDQTLILSATVLAGSGDNVGSYRYQAVTPTVLTAGEEYVIAAYLNNSTQADEWWNGVNVPITGFNANPAGGSYLHQAGNNFQDVDPAIAVNVFPAERPTLTSGWPAANFLFTGAAPGLSCVGFESPMAGGPVRVKKNRALPLRAQLFDADGIAITDFDLVAPPVVQVLYNSGGGAAVDVSSDALPAGLGDDGNQFVYTGARWQFNLKTKNYTASGTYTVLMASGDDTEYLIDPACEASFVIE